MTDDELAQATGGGERRAFSEYFEPNIMLDKDIAKYATVDERITIR